MGEAMGTRIQDSRAVTDGLKSYTLEELEWEVERRKRPPLREYVRHRSSDDAKLGTLIVQCANYLDAIDGGVENPDKHYVYAAAMKFIFGSDVFAWMQKKTKLARGWADV